jgi:hypothetical protein
LYGLFGFFLNFYLNFFFWGWGFFWNFWIVLDFWIFLVFYIFVDFFGDFIFNFFWFLSKLLRLLLNVTTVTTGHQKSPKMGQNSIKSSFFARRAKKASAEGRSPPQELEVGPRSGSYLLVLINMERQTQAAGESWKQNDNVQEGADSAQQRWLGVW